MNPFESREWSVVSTTTSAERGGYGLGKVPEENLASGGFLSIK